MQNIQFCSIMASCLPDILNFSLSCMPCMCSLYYVTMKPSQLFPGLLQRVSTSQVTPHSPCPSKKGLGLVISFDCLLLPTADSYHRGEMERERQSMYTQITDCRKSPMMYYLMPSDNFIVGKIWDSGRNIILSNLQPLGTDPLL